MNPILFSWKPRSEQGLLLAQELGATYVYRDNYAHIKPNKKQVVINWGCGGGWFPWRLSQWKRVFNKPEAISRAVGKIDTFRLLERKRIPVPEWTTNPKTALKWILAGGPVFARGDSEGNNGRGIRIYHLKKKPEQVYLQDILGIPLFTKGFPDHHTFRAFVFKGKVDRLYSVEHDDDYKGTPNQYIHNHKNGWVFYDANKSFLRPSILKKVSKAPSVLGLDFGAIDFGISKDKKLCIYEINSAFGGESEDARLNAKAFRKAFVDLRRAR